MIAIRIIPRVKPCISSSTARWKSTSNKSDLLKKANIALARQNGQTPKTNTTNDVQGPFENNQGSMIETLGTESQAISNSSTSSSSAAAAAAAAEKSPLPRVVDKLQTTVINSTVNHNSEGDKSSFDQQHLVTPKAFNSNKVHESYHQIVDKREATTAIEPNPSFSRMQFHQGHLHEFAPRIVVVGVGGGGGNAVNNMIANQLRGVDFLALNTDAQHLSTILTENRLQIGSNLTSGLGCGANPDAGRLAAEESREQITDLLGDAHMVFVTAGMGGGTGTGAAPVVAEICYNLGILTVGVVTKPFRFEGTHRMRLANEGIERLRPVVDTLIMIPNQNLFRLANDSTSFMDSFAMADNVLLAGVKSITDLMTTPGLINLDFADVQSVMHGMGNAMLGTGIASKEGLAEGEERAIVAAQQALSNPLLGENMDIGTAKGMLVNITGGKDMTLFEVDRAATCITERLLDENANIIFGSSYDETLDGSIRVSVVATGIEEEK
mmetsp:Transcript_16681/g.31600  ORF Transcript_16681/g.31600 Transcript_16681/m.31600 type:complete len:496 (+) Transcript_16681:136-1623(+)